MSSSSPNSRAVAWTVWMLASIFYAYQYVLRVMPNIMLQDIMQQFSMNAATFGQCTGVYYISYSLLHLPVGIMLDRFGPKKIMTGSILLTVVGLLPLLFASNWIYPIIGRFLIGIGSSAAILGIFKIIRMTFHENKFSRMLSLSVTIGLLGAIYGGGPVSYMHDTLGYHAVIKIFAIAGLLLAIITYWLVPDEQNASQNSVSASITEVLTNGRVVWSCIFAGLMVGPLEGFADVWGTAFLKHVYGFEGTAAASLPSMIFIGMCFGAPILSFIAEKVGNYLVAIIGAGIAMVICFASMLANTASPSVISLCFVVIGICCAYQVLAICQASTYVRQERAGLTTAVANMIIMIFGYVFHSVIGSVVHSLGGPDDPSALTYGVCIIPAALCIGTIGFAILFFKEKSLSMTRTKKTAS